MFSCQVGTVSEQYWKEDNWKALPRETGAFLSTAAMSSRSVPAASVTGKTVNVLSPTPPFLRKHETFA